MNLFAKVVARIWLAVSGLFAMRTRKQLANAELAADVARERSEALRALSTELVRVSSRDEVALVMADHGAKTVGAQLANIALLDRFSGSNFGSNSPEPKRGTASASFVLPSYLGEELSAKWTRLPLDVPTPLGDAIQTGSATFFSTANELDHTYPHLQKDRSQAGLNCLAAVPLTDSQGVIFGAAGFAWSHEQDFTAVQKTDIAIAAQICSQALERARAFDLERENSERARGLALAISGLVAAQIQADVLTAFRVSLAWLLAEDGLLGVTVDRNGTLRVLVPFADTREASPDDEVLRDEDVGGIPTFEPKSQTPDHRTTSLGNQHSTVSTSTAPKVSKVSKVESGVADDAPVSALLNLALVHVAQSGEPLFHDGISDDPNIAWLQQSQHGNFYPSLALLPLNAGGFTGAMVLRFSQSQPFSDKQRLDLVSFAALSSNALERARRAELEHEIAVTLQASLLPSVPTRIGRVSLAGRYLPGSRFAVVGGDWYDVIALPDQRILFVVGDVVGHGIQSAAAMGKLATATRALALVTNEPAELLTNLDSIAANDEAMRFASMAIVLADLHTGVLTISLAGHPAPMLRWDNGEVLELDEARSTSLGGLPLLRTQQQIQFQGTVDLVLYTDGLTERRDQHPTERIATMLQALRTGPRSPILLSDFLLSSMTAGEQSDDVALLCAQMTSGPPNFRRSIPSSAQFLAPLRKQFREWTEAVGMTEGEKEDLILAVGEAATNAIEHGNRSNSSLQVTVEARLRNDQLEIVVTDEGQWVVPTESHGLRGRGLELLRLLTDRVTIDQTQKGTVLRLLKVLQRQPEPVITGELTTKAPHG